MCAIPWQLDSPKQVSEREREGASGICSIFCYLAVACHFIRELHKVSIGILAKRQECLEGSLEAGYYSS